MLPSKSNICKGRLWLSDNMQIQNTCINAINGMLIGKEFVDNIYYAIVKWKSKICSLCIMQSKSVCYNSGF